MTAAILSKAIKDDLSKVEDLLSRVEKLTDSIRGNFVAAAMAGLAKNGNESDLPFARHFLAEKNEHYPESIETDAIQLIGRFGDESDVEGLVAIARKSHGEKKASAAMVALDLFPGTESVVQNFLNADRELFEVAGDMLINDHPEACKSIFEPYLKDNDEFKRAKAVLYLHKTCPKDLEQLLESYTSQDTYFYNVVCWLDRMLYAPELLKPMYLEEIDNL